MDAFAPDRWPQKYDLSTAQIAETGQSCLAVRKTGEAPVYRCEGKAWRCRQRFASYAPTPGFLVCERGKKPPTAPARRLGASAAEDQWELEAAAARPDSQWFQARYEQRELALCWVGWSASAKDEVPPAATRWGDRIDYVVLGTADGRQLRGQSWRYDRVRIAGIDAGDQLIRSISKATGRSISCPSGWHVVECSRLSIRPGSALTSWCSR